MTSVGSCLHLWY